MTNEGTSSPDKPEHVVAHEYLTVAVRPGADADGWYPDRGRVPRGQRRGDRLEHDCEGAGLFERLRRVENGVGLVLVGAALAVAAKLIDRLREEPEMTHHRNTDVDEPAHHVDDWPAAFDLHRGGPALLKQPSRIPHRIGGADLIGEERHVGDDERALAPRLTAAVW